MHRSTYLAFSQWLDAVLCQSLPQEIAAFVSTSTKVTEPSTFSSSGRHPFRAMTPTGPAMRSSLPERTYS